MTGGPTGTGEDGMQPRTRRVRCLAQTGHHHMVYDDYGPSDARHAVVCVHGLTRNGRDFERLAQSLVADGHRVLCPDIVGRGRSDDLAAGSEYGVPQYMADVTVMLAHAGLDSVDWIGTSMGGLIAMALTATPGHPIRRLAINDVGPRVPKAALRRIADYVGVDWRFDDFEAALEFVREVYAGFGLDREEDWRYLAEIGLRREADGTYVQAYDRRIAEPFVDVADDDLDLWGLWDAMTLSEAPLVLRGADSDLLLSEDLEGMRERGPGATVLEIPGCGHAPSLMVADQIEILRKWVADGERGATA